MKKKKKGKRDEFSQVYEYQVLEDVITNVVMEPKNGILIKMLKRIRFWMETKENR